jgi:predicted GIY-YIG superfamily endonuclease
MRAALSGTQLMPFWMKCPCIYILASRRNGTLYIGVTSNLPNRVGLHKQDLIEGFTKKYRVHVLAYYEMYPMMEAAIRREKRRRLGQAKRRPNAGCGDRHCVGSSLALDPTYARA